jgi:hypothetical protein
LGLGAQLSSDAPKAERKFPARIKIAVPPEGLGRQLDDMMAWLDANCGAANWAMAPAGLRGVANDALAIYFLDTALASGFVARWCIGYRVETVVGSFRLRDDDRIHVRRRRCTKLHRCRFRYRRGEWLGRFADWLVPRLIPISTSSASSIHAGAWSLAPSQDRAWRSTPAADRRLAADWFSRRWSIRRPASRANAFLKYFQKV